MPTNKSTKHAKRSSTTTPTTTTENRTTTVPEKITTTTTTTPKSTAPMMQYTNTEFPMQSALSKYDESTADLSAYLDFSSYATHLHPVVIPTSEPSQLPSSSFEHAFDFGAGAGPLRPVDDALLDSPLDLELSPASTTYDSSCFSSPFLVDDLVAGGSLSPVILADHLASSASSSSAEFDFGGLPSSSTTTTPSLFAPVPSLTTLMAGAAGAEIDMAALATSLGVTLPPLGPPPTSSSSLSSSSSSSLWASGGSCDDDAAAAAVAQPEPVSIPTLPFIREEVEEEDEDVKPDVSRTTAVVNLLVEPTPSTTTPSEAPSSGSSGGKKRKAPATPPTDDAAEAEAAACSKRDKFTGIRNTKKPPVAYDAPTLPKNYYTESATSKKRGSPSASSSSSSHKRARSTASATPEAAVVVAAVPLPSARPDPMAEDEFDESQLSAIELKRRQNTLAARRSRARKSAYIQELKNEIDALKQLNEQLQRQVADAGPGGRTCPSCGGGGGGAVPL